MVITILYKLLYREVSFVQSFRSCTCTYIFNLIKQAFDSWNSIQDYDFDRFN
jgi:hypothetical protein